MTTRNWDHAQQHMKCTIHPDEEDEEPGRSTDCRSTGCFEDGIVHSSKTSGPCNACSLIDSGLQNTIHHKS
jgi:hypothetical protein